VLLEREKELAAVAELIDSGGVLVVEGGAGIGKTSLLDAGCAQARARGWQILRGSGSQLETGFAFGAVRQLFERELAAADPRKRAELLAGPARAAASCWPSARLGEAARAAPVMPRLAWCTACTG
jgi:Rad3-related DNA helicase